MHLKNVTAAILFALIRTSESSLLCAGLDPMISKAVFLFSVSRTSTDFVWVHWFSLQGHLCHVASLPVILWNHGELICGSCHNIYLASRIPLLLGAFFPFGSICKMVLREVVLLPFDPFSELHKALEAICKDNVQSASARTVKVSLP